VSGTERAWYDLLSGVVERCERASAAIRVFAERLRDMPELCDDVDREHYVEGAGDA
jgi:hypothetical protein